MDRTRECFSADIPNLVFAKTEKQSKHHPTPPPQSSKMIQHQPPARDCEGKVGRNGRDTTASPRKERVDCGTTKLTADT